MLSELLTAEDISRMEAVDVADTDNFIQLIEILNLDRGVDLRHRDFSGVDFSDCDLRGCDFTGSDLRGSSGRNVVWDETTILTSAEVDRSMFANEPLRLDIAQRLPELGKEYARIKKAYWIDQAMWAMDSLKQGIKNPVERQALAMSLYFDASDGFVRNTILQYVIFGTAKEARLEFFHAMMADRTISTDALANALHTFGRILRNDEQIVLPLLGIAEDANTAPALAKAAVRAALRNRFVLRHNRRAYRLVLESRDPELENLYIRAFAGAVGVDHATAVSEGRRQGGVIFSETIGLTRVREIASNIWRARQAAEADPMRSERLIFKGFKNRDEFEPRVLQLLNELIEKGLRLNLCVTEVKAAAE
ncbi:MULTISPECIES: pentapeptide repeat-containing protein [unclassified Chelatococcus]|uniref:pentapeptide repeat-containing protein n=1 Tax=unclassified Chelatococcus TaxID=2638111 RepID=UPI001BCB1CB7|nr:MULTISPECIES: pentapeptide repeat-containing protein [unclassified Chelatococcus]MBS7740298.1 pentapeptide repeat-containing protein [Chelatococcus sp. HY11]MBX3544872.1 pentapeptide repeat-containing protein [Chelatococcus sp.]